MHILTSRSSACWITHFRVVPSLCFKARLSAKPLTQKNYFFLPVQIKTQFQKKRFALCLVLKVRIFGTRRWPRIRTLWIQVHETWQGLYKKMTTTKEGCHEISNFPSSCYMLRETGKALCNFSSICDCWSTYSGSDYKQNKTRITFVSLE